MTPRQHDRLPLNSFDPDAVGQRPHHPCRPNPGNRFNLLADSTKVYFKQTSRAYCFPDTLFYFHMQLWADAGYLYMTKLKQLGTRDLVVGYYDDYKRNQAHQRLSESDDLGEERRNAGQSSTSRPGLSQPARCPRPHVLGSSP